MEKEEAKVPPRTLRQRMMDLLTENTVDAAQEKHIPDYSRDGALLNVVVGSVEHPMDEKHYIEFVEVIAGEQVLREYLKPGQPPKAQFNVDADSIEVRAFCNLHGLWKK